MNTESAQYSQDHPEKTNLSSTGAEADFRQKTLARTDQHSTDGTLTPRLAGQGSRVKQGKQQAGGMVGGEQGAFCPNGVLGRFLLDIWDTAEICSKHMHSGFRGTSSNKVTSNL